MNLRFCWPIFLTLCFLTVLADDPNKLQDAAGRGEVGSQLKLAHALIMEKTYDEAIRWLEAASQMGSVEALRALGAVLATPDFKGYDQRKAFGYFAKAADRGDAMSQFVVATYFDQGDVIPQSPKDVIKWLRLSANGGYGPAQVRLAEKYALGVPGILPRSPVEAYALYRKALDTATSEISNFVDPKELVDRLAELKKDLTESDLRLAGNKRNSLFTQPLPDWSERTRYLGNGSGFIITRDGFLVSNHHVVEGGSVFLVKTAFGISRAEVKQVDRQNDLALLKIEGTFAPAPLVNSDVFARVGTPVFVYGYPAAQEFGQEEPKYLTGNISAADFVKGLGDEGRDFSFTAPITGGNSGGGLFDIRGNVVGVVVSGGTFVDRGSPYSTYQAVKSSRLLRFLERQPAIKSSLVPPIMWDRPSEEVAAETRQAVVLVGCYFSAYNYAFMTIPNLRKRILASMFEKATGKEANEDTAEDFKRFVATLPSKTVPEVLTRLINENCQKLGWDESEAREAVEQLRRDGKL